VEIDSYQNQKRQLFSMKQLTMDSQVSLKHAYLIMFDYLEGFYERNGKPDELGNLLGQLALWDSADGKEPMDAAVFPDWLDSAQRVISNESEGGYFDANIKLS
jgi:hypothetical protein